jgi:hypothetical protein
MPIFGYSASKFSIAYAYDYGLSALRSYNLGSNEIMVGYGLCGNSKKRRGAVLCPAYRFYRR